MNTPCRPACCRARRRCGQAAADKDRDMVYSTTGGYGRLCCCLHLLHSINPVHCRSGSIRLGFTIHPIVYSTIFDNSVSSDSFFPSSCLPYTSYRNMMIKIQRFLLQNSPYLFLWPLRFLIRDHGMMIRDHYVPCISNNSSGPWSGSCILWLRTCGALG